ncbi:MAG: hypothetical protein LBJ15_16340 [Comamonas sp.]|jgi:hypothetical protein|uniref:hypothetical protein n=1 Tax=Comamonas sp. TaxID=34028 RepID=UPI00282B33E7|nr:hypothetical protein [Comamonas sp.]MDR0215552.1 hypothetical protein [Comamonas sp.]
MTMFSEEDLAGLSEEERNSLLALEKDDEDLAGEGPDGQVAEGGAAAAAADLGGQDDAAGAADKGKVEGAEQAAAAEETAAAPSAEAEQEAAPAALLPVSPSDADEQRKALRAEKSQALQQLLDGEIDQEAYQEVESRVQDQLDNLARAAAVDMARTQLQQDTMIQEYGQHLGAAQKELKAAGIDLGGEAGAQFDRAIRLFAQEAAERGLSDAVGNMAASRDALAEAKALVLRRFGKAPTPAAATPEKPAAPARKPAPADRSALPPTLASVPAAADAAVGGEFAHLDGLEGSALEKALARLTPEQADRYLGA